MTAKVVFETVDFSVMRYQTVGDYFTRDDGTVVIQVAELGDWAMNSCVALHEFVEKTLCVKAGISDQTIDAFDFGWKPHDNIEEPGDDPACPYYRQHQQAMALERAFAAMLEVHWPEYERRIGQLLDGAV